MASSDGPGTFGDVNAGPKRGLPAGRLPSLRPPRDLTLGGIPKRTFTPNIPVRKERIKAEVIDHDHASSNRTAEARGRAARGGHDRGRGGRGRGGNDNIIQTRGIFEETSREPVRSRSNVLAGGGGGRARCFTSGGGDGVRESRIKREDEGEEEDSKEWLDNLMRDDTKDLNMVPVFLPVFDGHLRYDVKTDQDSKPLVKVKEEVDDDMDTRSISSGAAEIASVKSDSPELKKGQPTTAAELFEISSDRAASNLMLIQLPDVLPGHPPARDLLSSSSRDGLGNKSSDVGAQTSEQESLTRPIQTCSLADFTEGVIGQLQIRKSGRTQLVLGDIVLDVSLGTSLGFLQDLVSVRIAPDVSSGDMMVLGHVGHRLICVPDLENLLELSINEQR